MRNLIPQSLPVFALKMQGKRLAAVGSNDQAIYKTSGRSNYYAILLQWDEEQRKFLAFKRWGRPDLVDMSFIFDAATDNKESKKCIYAIALADAEAEVSQEEVISDKEAEEREIQFLRYQLAQMETDRDRLREKMWNLRDHLREAIGTRDIDGAHEAWLTEKNKRRFNQKNRLEDLKKHWRVK